MSDVLGSDPVEYYNKKRAELYDKSGAFRKIQTSMTYDALKLAGFKKGATIVDLGCGTGFSTKVLADEGFDAVGVDISRHMIILGKKKKLKKLVECDIKNMPFKNDSFDGAVSISTIQWLKPEEYDTAIMELKRILKPEGVAIVQFYPKNVEEFDYFLQRSKKAKFEIKVFDVGVGKKKKSYIRLKKRE